jgi:hypothetical protein
VAGSAIASGAAQAAGSNIMNAALATPQGHAAVGATLAVVIPLAVIGGVGYGVYKLCSPIGDW